ncbi:PaaX family transcriptional regulator C-terminal domain-containing protein [Microvirga thermotolerans]|uniref:Phenylacetic acid degradation operon negative regulatory protein PaaX n=1 Tax=Microvirga thermotolerans TaxID=2651334 RepID=A0A5P9JT76_9HYPH|nr:PaaX family transcriptional regulator C-terminal domain-containing protein [Microvirga thermotolerans]QFU15613.1 phenylacetic acid degradation operon negative regulatory protein PaaX [Microvirga thermotolerans]
MAAFVEALLDRFHERTPIRAGSLIVTVFGDAVVPRGGVLSLGSLHEIMRAFRISDTLVRTALSRLVGDGWFERWKVGRNSYYQLTAMGREAFAQATRRIYADPPQGWHGAFDLLLLENTQDRSALRAGLSEAGYGTLGPDLLISATASPGGEGPFLRLSATPADLPTARRLVERAWPLEEIEGRYKRFIATYSGTLDALEKGAAFTDLQALLVRILLIHDYRRAVLKDPLLPPQLLPKPWAGAAARELCGRIYKTLLPASERWIDTHAQNDRGPLPAAEPGFARRFAGVRLGVEAGVA